MKPGDPEQTFPLENSAGSPPPSNPSVARVARVSDTLNKPRKSKVGGISTRPSSADGKGTQPLEVRNGSRSGQSHPEAQRPQLKDSRHQPDVPVQQPAVDQPTDAAVDSANSCLLAKEEILAKDKGKGIAFLTNGKKKLMKKVPANPGTGGKPTRHAEPPVIPSSGANAPPANVFRSGQSPPEAQRLQLKDLSHQPDVPVQQPAVNTTNPCLLTKEEILAKDNGKGIAFLTNGKKKLMFFLFPLLLLLGWLASRLSKNGESGLESSGSISSGSIAPKVIGGVIATLVFCFIAKRMCCGPPKNHVWSENSKTYVPRKSLGALTTTEGGIGVGGWLLIMLIIGCICGYFAMRKDRPRGPIIPLHAPPPPKVMSKKAGFNKFLDFKRSISKGALSLQG